MSEAIKVSEGHEAIDIGTSNNGLQTSKEVEAPEYATGLRLVGIICTIFSATLLTALDLGIVATAIPALTAEFQKLDDIGWYGGTVFLTVAVSSPVWGKLFAYFSVRWAYMGSLLVFLLGCLICAVAQNSPTVIAVRAIQGLGAAGTLSGSAMLVNYCAAPALRPPLLGAWLGMFMLGTIIGPLVGGAFVTEVSWRWCFWIFLPAGGPILILVFLFLHIPKHIKPLPATQLERLLQLDLPGFFILLSCLIAFTLAMQWGGLSKPWSDGSVIAILVVFGVTVPLFILIEYYQGSRAMMPLSLLKPRMTWTNLLFATALNGSSFQVVFYIPLYIQSVHGKSALAASVLNLPWVAFFGFGAMLSGMLVGKTRLLQPYQIASGLIATAGGALLYTCETESSKARYVGPQILHGFGIGFGSQIPMMALQAHARPEEVASVTSIVLLSNAIAGALFVTAAQSIFGNRLLDVLAETAPELNAMFVLGTGASELREVFEEPSVLGRVVDAYMVGIKDVFAFTIALAGLAAVLGVALPRVKMPEDEGKRREEGVVVKGGQDGGGVWLKELDSEMSRHVW